jgi:hypothetical protein
MIISSLSRYVGRIFSGALVGALITVAGCDVAPPTGATEQALTGPLGATPSAIDFGTFRANTTASQRVRLQNSGRVGVHIGSISLLPPDPCSPPDPCVPPDPCHISLVSANVPAGESTYMTLSCTPTVTGTMGFTTRVDYTAGTSSFSLAIPVSGVVN